MLTTRKPNLKFSSRKKQKNLSSKQREFVTKNNTFINEGLRREILEINYLISVISLNNLQSETALNILKTKQFKTPDAGRVKKYFLKNLEKRNRKNKAKIKNKRVILERRKSGVLNFNFWYNLIKIRSQIKVSSNSSKLGIRKKYAKTPQKISYPRSKILMSVRVDDIPLTTKIQINPNSESLEMNNSVSFVRQLMTKRELQKVSPRVSNIKDLTTKKTQETTEAQKKIVTFSFVEQYLSRINPEEQTR